MQTLIRPGSPISWGKSDTYTSPNDFIQQLSGSGYKVGTGIVIKVMAGDTVNIRANSWYNNFGSSPNTPNTALASIITALAGGITGVDPTHFNTAQLGQTGVLDPGMTNFLTQQSSDYATHNTIPKAYLNYVLFDEQFREVYTNDGNNTGFDQVGADTVFKTHVISNRRMTKSGYLYVYISNETPNINVYFDNLQLTHMRGQIVEETHYYPFGLAMAAISSQEIGKPENRFKYNGKELQHQEFSTGAGLEEYDYGARFYDPQIGRWGVIDKMGDKYAGLSPFSFAADCPIKFNDPDGNEIKPVGTAEEIKQINTALAIVAKTNPDIYKALGDAKEVFQISVGDIAAKNDVDVSTGNSSKVGFEDTPSSTDQKGSFTVGFKVFGEVRDDDPDPNNIKLSREDNTGDQPTRVSISTDDANKLVKLDDPVIEIDRNLGGKEFGAVLAHEFGHAAYTLQNSATAYFRPGPPASKGHDKGNPNGEAADKAEKEFEAKYKEILKQLKIKKKKTGNDEKEGDNQDDVESD